MVIQGIRRVVPRLRRTTRRIVRIAPQIVHRRVVVATRGRVMVAFQTAAVRTMIHLSRRVQRGIRIIPIIRIL